ncbi:alpha/beta family hydrolase [Mangrovicoccus sp. HB161399]|uniref:alpha/beta family hydrolase n=1 Tax=Mangrovicoccus sp. HB161399 TaxID=2720392 RepID=UPI001553D513|nr:alpha/beta family hydrolase [Mangrovicoccus sp. HB161399]
MQFLLDGGGPDRPMVLLAHGAGAPMDTPFMDGIAAGLAAAGLNCARFEFGYMAARRSGGPKRPPPRAEALCGEYIAAAEELAAAGPLIVGGKSLGGRVASLVAEELFRTGRAAGLACLGYPFHPPGKPERLRTAHLEKLAVPALICQGSRDPFGTREEVAGYALSPAISFCWLEDGDHDLKPRKRVTAASQADHIGSAAAAIAAWTRTLRSAA